MLSYILATIVGLGSVAFYMAAFFFPEVYRKGDFVWSSIGFFYALVLWFCAGQMGGAVLLGQTASVALVAWLGWQTLKLRRETTPLAEQTNTAAIAQSGILPTAIAEKITTLFPSGNQSAIGDAPVSVPQPSPDVAEVFADPAESTGETVAESMTTQPTPESIATPSWEPKSELPADENFQQTPETVFPVFPESDFGLEGTPVSRSTPETPSIGKPSVEEDWQDTFDEPVSAPTPVPPPPPARSVSPKSQTFGFLASLLDRVKGLLGKGKPQPLTPKTIDPVTKPPVVAAVPNPATIQSQNLETVAFPETVEMAMTQGIDILESAEALESALAEETSPSDPPVEIVVSPAPEALESGLEEENNPSAPPVEIVVSPAPEALESARSEEETSPSAPPVEIVVSQQITVVTSNEAIDSLFAAEGETSQSPPQVEILISQEIKTVEVPDCGTAVPSENLTGKTLEPLPADLEASIGEDKAPSSDDTRPTPD